MPYELSCTDPLDDQPSQKDSIHNPLRLATREALRRSHYPAPPFGQRYAALPDMNIGLDCSLLKVRRLIGGNFLDARDVDEKYIYVTQGET